MASVEVEFHPPTAAQVGRHLRRYGLQAPSRFALWLPLLAMGGAIGLIWTDSAEGAFGAWVLLGAWMGYHFWRARRQRELERLVSGVQELSMLRRDEQALRQAWLLVPKVRRRMDLHARLLTVMGHVLEELSCYEPAMVVYDALLARLPREHPASVHLGLARIMALLATDRLSDADEALRRFRGVVESGQGNLLGALYRLAELYQMVRTNHFADAVGRAAVLVEDLRPLGLEAGYGYALMALAYYRQGVRVGGVEATPGGEESHTPSQPPPPRGGGEEETGTLPGVGEQDSAICDRPLNKRTYPGGIPGELPGGAGEWWGRATLLVGAEQLVGRFGELGELAWAMRAFARRAPGDDKQRELGAA
ncbi:MAG: hypothetical protein IT443_12150 [Phycisphaeraceae bacterium]|nr:hypothetical protein [Phycisphaeraceae bacterium]